MTEDKKPTKETGFEYLVHSHIKNTPNLPYSAYDKASDAIIIYLRHGDLYHMQMNDATHLIMTTHPESGEEEIVGVALVNFKYLAKHLPIPINSPTSVIAILKYLDTYTPYTMGEYEKEIMKVFENVTFTIFSIKDDDGHVIDYDVNIHEKD